MKKTIQLMIAGALVLGAVSCAKEIASEENSQPSGPVTLTATIVNESSTKATLNDGDGAFAFSGTDAIKVYNGSACYESTGVSINKDGVASFTMADGFTNSGSGLAAFPASMVSDITASGVTFTLPSNYTYAQVGGTIPSETMVPCPMIATFTAGDDLHFQQAGAVVRIRVTNIVAGSLTFTFETNITGITGVVKGAGKSYSISLDGYAGAGKTITVTGVPEVEPDNYIYITLPVPSSTVPQNILVTNEPSDASSRRMASITGSSTALARAKGYKCSVSPAEIQTPSFKVGEGKYVVLAPGNLMAKIGSFTSPTATASEWKFGGFSEYIGASSNAGNYLFANSNSDCVGKWIDLFSWQGASASNTVHGMVSLTSPIEDYIGKVSNEPLYSNCWKNLEISNGGDFTWRPMTYDEWMYLLDSRTGANVGTETMTRHIRATVAGVKGLLIFPDSNDNIWTVAMGTAPNKDKVNKTDSDDFTTTYTASNMVEMARAGVVFLPASGYRDGTSIVSVGKVGYYWSSSSNYNNTSESKTSANSLRFRKEDVAPAGRSGRRNGIAVRLVRDL